MYELGEYQGIMLAQHCDGYRDKKFRAFALLRVQRDISTEHTTVSAGFRQTQTQAIKTPSR